MGCNFYIYNPETKELKHIGKRSAAGRYCWDCGVTLCIDGEYYVHYSDHAWYDYCPKCGRTKDDEDKFSESSVARELGFNDNPPKK